MTKIHSSLLAIVGLATPAFSQTPDTSNGHLLSDRWTFTATDGGGLGLGDATRLTWGFLDDGTSIAGNAGELASNSSLISFLDTNIGSGGGGTDLTTRPWFEIFENSYNRWGEVSGLSFSYEANDGGAALDNTSSPTGSLGTYADMRIGGHSIDGQANSNTLAYNFFPNHGDMVIDTDNTTFFSNASNSFIGFRNVITHEIGHGLGVDHLESSNERFLMEPFIDTSFDGPQHSDILAVQRGYGDIYEADSGNDSAANATALGNVSSFAGIGFDGDNADVAGTDVDFVSIDGSSDTDFYSITLAEDGMLDVALEAMGLQYQIREQAPPNTDPPYTSVDTSMMSDMILALFGPDGTTLIESSDSSGLGGSENIVGRFLPANTYFLRVTGKEDRAQFYSLSTAFTVVVPEPSNVMLLGLSCVALLFRRRR